MIPLYLKAGPNNEIRGPAALAIGSAWAMHYRNLLSQPDFTEKFHLYCEYNIYLHTKWLTLSSTFSPAEFQEGIFQDIIDWDQDSILARYAAQFRSHSTPPTSTPYNSHFQD
jgi:hypothetical protein